MATDDQDEGFLARWSRLKRAPEPAEAPEREGEAGPAAGPPRAVAKPASDAAPAPAPAKIDPADLPPVDSLTSESDFTAFLREGVPDALRRQAMRKLWVSDPVIAATDVLDVYNLDYFNMPSFPEGVKTLFRVGHGMLNDAEREAERKAAEEAARAAAAADSAEDEAPAADEPAEKDAADVASQHADDLPLTGNGAKSADS